MPECATVSVGRVAFCVLAVKLPGPLQLQVLTLSPAPVRVSVPPAQAGLGLALALTLATLASTVTASVADWVPQVLLAVTDTV